MDCRGGMQAASADRTGYQQSHPLRSITLADFKNQTLGGDIALDGNTYVDIVFDGARLVYEGGGIPVFQNCTFMDGCSFTFQEQAGNTLAFIRSMSHPTTNMRFIVEGLIPELGLSSLNS